MWWYWIYSESVLNTIKQREQIIYERAHVDVEEIALQILFISSVFSIVRFLLFEYVFKLIGETTILNNGFGQLEVSKFCESMWRLLFYTSSSIAIIVITLQQDYFYYPWQVWWVDMEPEYGIKWLYYIEMGWYFHQLFVHVYVDLRKSDFLIMLIHHFITLVLLLFSWMLGYHRIGLMVLFSHDACDPFLEVGKISNYLGRANVGIVSFVGLVTSWIVLRLMFFPTIIYTCYFESMIITGHIVTGFWLMSTFLIVLQLLHIYWFYLIINVGIHVWAIMQNSNLQKGVDFDSREKINK